MAATLMVATQARADPVASLALEPAPAGDRGIAVEHASVHGDRLLSVRFVVDIANRPLIVLNRLRETDVVLASQLWLHSLVTYAYGNRFAVHLDVPLLLNQDEGDHPRAGGLAAPPPDGAIAFGDLRLGARLDLLDPDLRSRRHYDVALGATAWFPTGNDAYTSDGAIRAGAGISIDGDAYGFYWAANAGVKGRPPVKLGFTSPLYSGAGFALAGAAGIFLDHSHALSLGPEATLDTTFVGTTPFAANGTVTHLLFGAHYLPNDGPLEVGAAAGPDFLHGPGAGGYQVLVVVGMVPERALLPPPDRDGDGILDADDACISTPGVRSDDPEKNGCPPVVDADSDGIPDADDACPMEPGPRNPDRMLNGCPPVQAPPEQPPEAKAELAAEQIVISQQVVFETNSAVLLPESNEILTEVARLITAHDEIELLEVQGHTDERGTAEYNRKLSQDRAASVVAWLTEHGIAGNRLKARGYGRDKPIADNSTEEGMQKNRRVEFHVLKTRQAAP
jgi:outer membrane protein OmpA-like peptidoglycan-associated protein